MSILISQDDIKMADKLHRIAVINADRCKPNKCRQECRRNCPVNTGDKLCITVQPKIANISEELCIDVGFASRNVHSMLFQL